jgi:hypothetical protein
MSYTQQQLIKAHADYLQQCRLQWWDVYYINIVFAHYLVPTSERFSIMRMAVEKHMYPGLITTLEHHPGRQSRHAFLPRLFLWGDLPVFKYHGSRSRRVVNDGVHLNGFLMISPSHQGVIEYKWKGNIRSIFRKNAHIHRAALIYNIHLELVEDDGSRVTDYAMKTITRGRLDSDYAIVLPEPWRPKPRPEPQDPGDRVIKDIESELNVSESVAARIAKARTWENSHSRVRNGR